MSVHAVQLSAHVVQLSVHTVQLSVNSVPHCRFSPRFTRPLTCVPMLQVTARGGAKCAAGGWMIANNLNYSQEDKNMDLLNTMVSLNINFNKNSDRAVLVRSLYIYFTFFG